MSNKISIITINHNTSSETIDFLTAIREQSDRSFDVILIDNASDKLGLDSLNTWLDKTYIPGLNVIKNSENLGFSGGCNIGMRKALENGSEWVILLNNDTIPGNDFIVDLGAILRDGEGLVAIPLDEGTRTAYCGQISWLRPTLKHLYVMPTKTAGCYAIGGGMAIHKSMIEKIGYLDENYFLYFEDADYSVRAARAKLPFVIASDIKVRHKVSASTKKIGSPRLFRYHYRNALYFNNKLGPWHIRLLIWPWSALIVAKQLVKIIFRKDTEYSRAIFRGVRDFYRNKLGMITLDD